MELSEYVQMKSALDPSKEVLLFVGVFPLVACGTASAHIRLSHQLPQPFPAMAQLQDYYLTLYIIFEQHSFINQNTSIGGLVVKLAVAKSNFG
jgi:hypothetical protein